MIHEQMPTVHMSKQMSISTRCKNEVINIVTLKKFKKIEY